MGLQAQQAAVAEYLERTGGELFAEFTEVESGRKADRPELGRALELCRRKKLPLLIAKLDRLARGVALGNPNIREVGKKGQAASVAAADRFAESVWPIIESLREEGLNLSKTARELNERGIKTRTGRIWVAQTVKNLFNKNNFKYRL